MAWRNNSQSQSPASSGPKAIPGYTGHLRSAKDTFGVSTGKALELDAQGNDGTCMKKADRSAAGSSLLSPLDCDGAVWDHRYETSKQSMDHVIAADFEGKLAAQGVKPQPTIVGYTGHIHMGQDVLGASHDAVCRISDNNRAEQRLRTKPPTEEARPHWSTFRSGNPTNPAWKQEYAQLLTTRPSAKGKPGAGGETEAQKERILQQQIKAAEAVLGRTPTASPSSAAGFKASFKSTKSFEEEESIKPSRLYGPEPLEEEKNYTGHFTSALPSRRIVGYTGHLRGAQERVGVNFGRVERKTDPFEKFVDPPHPLGQRYQNAAPPGPPVSAAVKALVQKPSKPKVSGNGIIDNVVAKIMQRGGRNGFRTLSRMLRVMDDDGSKCLNRYELLRGLNNYGVYPSQQEMDELMVFFDRDGSGSVSLTEFVRAVRGEMSDERRELVLQAYALLDANCNGVVTINDLKELYDTAQHPEVLAGEKTAKEVLLAFSAGWDRDGNGTVTEREFIEYYNDISAGIDNDQYFELMMRNAWHISGGFGAAANTSCRRVLVIHTDGSQTVEEVENDLGITMKDKDKILQRLMAQGVTDIQQIQPY